MVAAATVDAAVQYVDHNKIVGLSLLPVSQPIRQDWWPLAVILGIVGAAVGVQHSGLRIRGFVIQVAVLLVTILPIVVAGYVIHGAWLTVISTLAYLAFHATLGVMVGGTVIAVWSVAQRNG